MRWIFDGDIWSCEACGCDAPVPMFDEEQYTKWPFCPMCGAKMEEKHELKKFHPRSRQGIG